MYYINLLLIALMLSSCASTSTPGSNSHTLPAGNHMIQSQADVSRYKQAITLLNSGKYNEAEEIFIQFTEDNPELAGPYVNLALIAIQNKQVEKAYTLVKTALMKNPKLAQALNLLAYFEQKNGQFLAAEKHYKEAIKHKANYALAHYNLALLYDIYLQNIDKAIFHYQRYIALTNNSDKATIDWVDHLKRSKTNG